MHLRLRFLFSILVLSIVSLASPWAMAAGTADFSRYVALGDSLTAGFQSGSLVITGQENSYPLQIARQAGVASSFQQPLVSSPGIPSQLRLTALLPAVVISTAPGQGVPLNLSLPRPYNNLAVPGATSVDLVNTKSGGLYDVVLRGLGTELEQAVAMQPTFVTLWIGNNDILGAAISGQFIEGVTVTPLPIFQQAYTFAIQTLRTATTANIVVANIPDVTSIPYVTTLSRFVVNPATGAPVIGPDGQPVPLIGPTGPLPSGSYVLLPATQLMSQGIGIPVALGGTGRPLPDQVTLLPDEVEQIRTRTTALNGIISSVADANNIPVVDANALLARVASQGIEVGGVDITSDFLTGGAFSYDGVHPTGLGYGIVANEFIRVINGNFNANLTPVNLSSLIGIGSAEFFNPSRFTFTRAAYKHLLRAFPRRHGRKK